MSADPVRLLLRRLDTALEAAVLRLRSRYQLSLDEFRGLYVSDEQVDALLLSRGIAPVKQADLPPLVMTAQLSAIKAAFGLDMLEADLLVMAAAAAIDPRYPTLFAYLNDDVARRLPTLELVQRLLAENAAQRSAVRQRLTPTAPLRQLGLISLTGEDEGGLAAIAAPPAVVAHLLGDDAIAAAGLSRVAPAQNGSDDALTDALRLRTAGTGAVLLLSGRDSEAMRRHAAAVCAELGCQLALRPDPTAIDRSGSDAVIAAMAGAALLIEVGNAPVPPRWADRPALLIIAAETAAPWERLLASVPLIRREYPLPGFAERQGLWRDSLRREGLRASPRSIELAAGRFRLHGTAIARAARDARLENGGNGQVPPAALLESSRRQARLDLGELAGTVSTRQGWNDLVLPQGVLAVLHDLADACALRGQVYEEWGMAAGGRGSGLAALFCGNSGTGKTLSAGVVASAAGLDMWRIDLSSVVSKYIGETEKNLEKIFTAARDGDAILFFDEADAIFGKRSEVRDAHDRYANIEVAYLLQRLEEHDGVVILASNFRANIDTAFLRRLHYVVEFPMPDAPLREKLWRRAFATGVPLASDIDHAMLARQFDLTGGDIRTSALDAAFLAAADDSPVSMGHIVSGITRQLLKQGRLPPRIPQPREEFGASAAPLAVQR